MRMHEHDLYGMIFYFSLSLSLSLSLRLSLFERSRVLRSNHHVNVENMRQTPMSFVVF